MFTINTKKDDLKFAIAMFKEDCLKGVRLNPKQKRALDYFIKNLNQLIK